MLLALLFLALVTYAWADDYIYDSPYGGSVIGESDSKEGAGYWLLEEGEE